LGFWPPQSLLAVDGPRSLGPSRHCRGPRAFHVEDARPRSKAPHGPQLLARCRGEDAALRRLDFISGGREPYMEPAAGCLGVAQERLGARRVSPLSNRAMVDWLV